ncbi:hypothetical protein GYMC10_1087 [Paenibacillus sp. Y412MC10]|nr:hypothetical protein GYMC10_1087 [Paenibacillus sp. Y412MC10]
MRYTVASYMHRIVNYFYLIFIQFQENHVFITAQPLLRLKLLFY